ncbi:hypothetical protein TBLA_0F00340 [Henningerozyma blattae CBS 6284]|uniref:Rad21/Rec8-like protein N-terminal domain-containing protein n=1 Tax=Henningerozyma blattae (strain ATCC 34711 / CBS 6284 / DSM 70876 / NBRC 10599 / NRRL Y-10934 / UCD 77-7) TaxID=1071380 RepID=I2H5C6_HENB6|nr:hypothetical protein TBLA_0F00340 [Tetrapisispora blattae CBS 6284]CCH61578.1 hypothetical protein TBLA_0F00340 [Tetrapisispora blattae CBS 6284]
MSEIIQPLTVVKITKNNGPLAQIWLAANMTNLSRGSVQQTDVVESAKELAKVTGCIKTNNSDRNNNEDDNEDETFKHITLRTSGELLQGIVRVYSKQAGFLLSDIKDTLSKISALFKTNQRINITLNKTNTITRIDQLILEDAVTENEVLTTPGLEFLDETPIPTGLLGKDNASPRKVRGAVPWMGDTSIEVGRKFGTDEALDDRISSGLDLNFDIDSTNLSNSLHSKTFEEGTRNTTNNDISIITSTNQDIQKDTFMSTLENDDFGVEANQSDVEWDLGITENDNINNNNANNENYINDAGSDISIETGRRADDMSMTNEPTDFGFNLDIDKEDINMIDEESEIEPTVEGTNEVKEKTREPRHRRNSALINVNAIQSDKDTELNQRIIENRHTVKQYSDVNTRRSQPLQMTQKRLWTQVTDSMSYLPTNILQELINSNALKRQKLNPSDDSDDNVNFSLSMADDNGSDGLDEAPLDQQEQNIGSDIENEMPYEANIDQPTDLDLNDDALSENTILTEQSQSSSQSQKVKVTTGETVSESLVNMAELLRTHFIDNDSVDFEQVLDIKTKKNLTEEQVFAPTTTKKVASKSFFEMLSLANTGCIEMNQEEEFGKIDIKTTHVLYEKFIEV